MEKLRHTMGTSSGGQQVSHMEEGLNPIRLCLLGNTTAPAPTVELLVDAQKVLAGLCLTVVVLSV